MVTASGANDYIAGKLTGEDWKRRKTELLTDPSANLWRATFEDFLFARLSLRYLKPIEIIQSENSFQGEGFAIVSIQCALLEFLAALKLGKNYKFYRNSGKIGIFEYSSSNKLFCDFLTSEAPFKSWFKARPDAEAFYSNVRCALLHEARTKDGWRIWASGEVGVDSNKKIVRRNALQIAINDYIESYGLLLTNDKRTQEAFIRKFDHLSST